MQNHFIHPASEYKRDLDLVKHYIQDAATYIHKQTGDDYETCYQFVLKKAREPGRLGIKDPPVLCLTRNQYGDREQEEITFNEYIKDIVENGRIVSPALTVYQNPDVMPSLTSEFIDKNIIRRNVSKRAMFKAKLDNNEELTMRKDNEQTSFKISNNSLSGAQASAGTVLFNKSAHPSLTSTCRIATSYGNANNEKFLHGNRHYWNAEVVKANIISVINSTDYSKLEKIIADFNIYCPTPEETMEMIEYSTKLYWGNEDQFNIISRLVTNLTPAERAAFVYTGDLYHLAKFNRGLVYGFLDELSRKVATPIDNPETYIIQLDNDLKALVSLLCADELAGNSIATLETNNPTGYMTFAATAKNVFDTLDKYQDLITCLWRSDTHPGTASEIRSIVRRGVLTSDTDSTIFTVQNWVEWYSGQIDFSEKSKAVSYAVVYLATQTLSHILAKISAMMGVKEERIFSLAMKNEYSFPVFALTPMTKHYFAYISAREGNVYKDFDTEIKGVYLKDSNAPAHIMKKFDETLMWTLNQVMIDKKINLHRILVEIAKLEKDVETSVKKGSSFYLKSGSIKDKMAYKTPDKSPYNHHIFWNEVFKDKYGEAPNPPYGAVRISVDLTNGTKKKEWLDGIKDLEIRDKIDRWMTNNNKGSITSFLLPRPIVNVHGVPEELIGAMDIRTLIYTTVKPFYILLETLGFYIINGNITRLVSDFITLDDLPEVVEITNSNTSVGRISEFTPQS